MLSTLVHGAVAGAPMVRAPCYGPALVLEALLRLVSGCWLTLCYTIGGLMVPPEVRTTAFGFFSGAALFGGAISPSIAGLLAHASLRGVYWLDAALSLALVLFVSRRTDPAGVAPTAVGIATRAEP